MEEAHAAENTGENQDRSEAYVNRNAKATPDAAHVMQKSGQATVVVLELGRGNSDRIGVREATHMVQEVLDTPGHTINRMLVIRHDVIIVDSSRPG